MSTLRRAVTTIVATRASAGNTATRTLMTKEVAPHKELTFPDLPPPIARALHLIQRESVEATQGARSLPCAGGTYWPNVVFSVDTSQRFAHGCQGRVAWLEASVRPTASQSPTTTLGRRVEVSQNVAAGTVTLQSSEACIADVWFYPQPSAADQSGNVVTPAASGSGSGGIGAPFLWGSVRPYDTVAAGTTFVAYQDHEYRVTSNGAGCTAHLDPSPTDGHRVGFKLVGTPVANAFTIATTVNAHSVELIGTAPGTFGNTTTYWTQGGTLYLKWHAGSNTWNECL